jgi:hypothetical protein
MIRHYYEFINFKARAGVSHHLEFDRGGEW